MSDALIAAIVGGTVSIIISVISGVIALRKSNRAEERKEQSDAFDQALILLQETKDDRDKIARRLGDFREKLYTYDDMILELQDKYTSAMAKVVQLEGLVAQQSEIIKTQSEQLEKQVYQIEDQKELLEKYKKELQTVREQNGNGC